MIQTNLEIIKTITVFDVMGNTKYAIKSSEKNISIQDVSLSKGIYFVKIATENIVVTKKIVVE
ncbi:MAG: T9SS C-terminal target domain-containing protein [Cytophagales bacterium]|nr:MAG: T9SS C-terminal target domain-containing protein [Cytophagales bacterium]